MFSITGVAASCSLYSQGAGCPCPPNAAPPNASAAPPTANPSNRRPIWPFDIVMPRALLVSELTTASPPGGRTAERSAPRQTALGKSGQIVRTHRNPASQTIILWLSQCSSKAWSNAFGGIVRTSYFSRQIRLNRNLSGLTALDRRIVRCTHKRDAPQEPDSGDGAAHPAAGFPSPARHCRISPT